VRILGDQGFGTYADVIEGIQFVVANKETYNIRVMNLSLSAYATVPYFVDPLNRAVGRAWANGLVVVAAAGNEGSSSETITVPGWVDSNGNGWVDPDELDPAEMADHYQGRVSRATSDDDQVYIYYMTNQVPQ
jgi:subtilisin family serine protease